MGFSTVYSKCNTSVYFCFWDNPKNFWFFIHLSNPENTIFTSLISLFIYLTLRDSEYTKHYKRPMQSMNCIGFTNNHNFNIPTLAFA